jgi:CubicO group peptidase (beta-lactamase class C family)
MFLPLFLGSLFACSSTPRKTEVADPALTIQALRNPAETPQPSTESLPEAYKARASALLTRGLAVAITQGRTDVKSFTFGDCKSEEDAFEIGSLSKTFTGVILAELSIEKKLDLEAPISDVIPELAGRPLGAVTPYMLATHTAGLPRALKDGSGKLSQNYSETELISFLTNYQRDYAELPRGLPHYSNLGFGVLGLIIHRVDHRPLGKSFEKRIFQPLGMSHSGLILTPQAPKGLLRGYDLLLELQKYSPLSEFAAAAGGVYSDLSDMKKWLSAQVRPDETTPLGQAIVLSQQFALGWDSSPADTLMWKNGAMIDGFSSYLAVDRSAGQSSGVLVLSNVLNSALVMGVGSLARGLKDPYLGYSTLRPLGDEDVPKYLGLFVSEKDAQQIDIHNLGEGWIFARLKNDSDAATVRLLPVEQNDVYWVLDSLQISDFVQFKKSAAGEVQEIVYYSHKKPNPETQKVNYEPQSFFRKNQGR